MVKKFLQHVVPGVLKPIRVLWNEIIGFLFLAIGAWTSIGTYRRVSADSPDSVFHLVLGGLFSAVMLYFGVTSFLRARKISRS